MQCNGNEIEIENANSFVGFEWQMLIKLKLNGTCN